MILIVQIFSKFFLYDLKCSVMIQILKYCYRSVNSAYWMSECLFVTVLLNRFLLAAASADCLPRPQWSLVFFHQHQRPTGTEVHQLRTHHIRCQSPSDEPRGLPALLLLQPLLHPPPGTGHHPEPLRTEEHPPKSRVHVLGSLQDLLNAARQSIPPYHLSQLYNTTTNLSVCQDLHRPQRHATENSSTWYNHL